MKRNHAPTVVIQAVDFCYGPSAIAIAVAAEMRQIAHDRIEIVGIGKGVAAELLRQAEFFDRLVIDHTPNNDQELKEVLTASESVVVVCDFEFAALVRSLSLTPVFIDPLFWLWDEFPSEISSCNPYYVLDFPGVSELVKRTHLSNLKIIPQVAYALTRNRRDGTSAISNVIINFGGMQSPLGCNDLLAATMVAEIAEAVLYSFASVKEVWVRSGEFGAAKIRAMLPSLPSIVSVGSVGHSKFQEELAGCDILLTVPGMSIVYEALLTGVQRQLVFPTDDN